MTSGCANEVPDKASSRPAPIAPPAAERPFGWLQTRTGMKPPHRILADNWQSGVTVALVSVPLSISLGIASVAGDDPAAPSMGVATAFWGGLCNGLLGSSDLNIVGPAGALSGMLNSYTIQYNGAGVLPYISLISAAFVFLIYVMNLQRFLLLMPKAVFEGFTMAVAIIIGMNQMNMAFDLKPPGPKRKHFHENVFESFKVLGEASAAPTIFFFVTAALLLGLMKYFPKVRGYAVPWTVIIPLFTLLLGYLSESDNFGGIVLPTLKSKFGTLEPRVFKLPSKPLSHYAGGEVAGVLTASVGVAFVAVLETLISAKIAEQKMDWPFADGQETLGLFVSHLVCGAAGALPPTGVFVRTSLNMQLGATHRFSQVLNALVVLIISVAAMPLFSFLPQASVAALLVFASIRMAPVRYVLELWRHDLGSCALLVVVTLICVFLDPVYGLIVGMVLALLRDAAGTSNADSRLGVIAAGVGPKQLAAHEAEESYSNTTDDDDSSGRITEGCRSAVTISGDEFDRATEQSASASPLMALTSLIRGASSAGKHAPSDFEVDGAVVVYEPIGPLGYLAADRHSARLQTLQRRKPQAVVISLQLMARADVDGAAALGKAIKQLLAAGIRTEIILPAALVGSVIDRAPWMKELREGGHVWQQRGQAIQGRAACLPEKEPVAMV